VESFEGQGGAAAPKKFDRFEEVHQKRVEESSGGIGEKFGGVHAKKNSPGGRQ